MASEQRRAVKMHIERRAGKMHTVVFHGWWLWRRRQRWGQVPWSLAAARAEEEAGHGVRREKAAVPLTPTLPVGAAQLDDEVAGASGRAMAVA